MMDGISELHHVPSNLVLHCATTNPGKAREFDASARRLGYPGIHVELLAGMSGIEPPEETGATFVANAELKAIYYSRFSDHMVFADDSGLCVDALNGAPGVYSARFGGAGLDDRGRLRKLLAEMDGSSDRRAHFACAIAVARAGELLISFEERAEGVLLDAPRGEGGFGYDPIFLYEPLGRTFAELTPEEKLPVSHRGKAIQHLFAWVADRRAG
jgi:XTP/dITP diphosphohydrolase